MAEPLARETIMTPPFAAEASPAVRRLRSSLPAALRSRLRSARELERELRQTAAEGAFPTAVPALDRLLDGGLPRGQLVELIGSRSSGRFSLLLAALAAVTSVGEAAALIDLGDGLDPEAALSLGDRPGAPALGPAARPQEGPGRRRDADRRRLPPGGARSRPAAGARRWPRGGEASWLRLARTARAHRSALLVGTPYRVSGTAAAMVLKAGRSRAAWRGAGGSPRLLAGAAARIVLEKCRSRLPGRGEDLAFAVTGAPRSATEILPAPRVYEQRPAVPYLRAVR